MSDDRIIASIQRELTRLVGIAEATKDTASVEVLLRAKQELGEAHR